MTDKAEQKTIVPGITEDAAETGTSELKMYSPLMWSVSWRTDWSRDAAGKKQPQIKKERLILPTSSILPSTVPQRHTFSVTMRESVQLEMPVSAHDNFASAIDGYTDFKA